MRRMYMLLALLVLMASVITSCGQNYSKGTAANVIVTKLSERGVIFKSWEGEAVRMTASGMQAGAPVYFNAGECKEQLLAALYSGEAVNLDYSQWAITPLTITNPKVIKKVVLCKHIAKQDTSWIARE